MNAIDINGISFTPESLQLLTDWLETGLSDQDSLISVDIEALEKAQSLIIIHWESITSNNDFSIKEVIIPLQYVIERLRNLSQINKKTIPNICNQTSSDNCHS